MNTKIQSIIERYSVLVVGLFIMAAGISFSIRAGLGITPISCPPYVLSQHEGWLTVGQFTILMHVIFVLGQIVLLRRDFQMVQLLQLALGLVFGLFIDFTNWLIQGLVPQNYVMQIIFVLIGCLCISIGVTFQVNARVVTLAGEGIMLAIATKLKRPYSKVKVYFDVSLVAIAVVFSFCLYGRLVGVREGTVIAALLVGVLAGKWQPLVGDRLAHWLNRRELAEQKAEHTERRLSGTPVTVITIAREFGSGGHEIGERVARELGWTFVDQQLIDSSLAERGMDNQFIVDNDQRLSEGKRLWKFVTGENMQPVEESLAPADRLFVAQGKAIREAAERGKCVIVGRCANWFLRDEKQGFHVFVSAALPFAVERIRKEFGYDEAKARTEINKVNANRAKHYNYYTGEEWGDSKGYDLCAKSSSMGIENIVAALVSVAKQDGQRTEE